MHAFGTLLALGIIWAVLERKKQWWAFLLPALLLGVPVAIWLSGGGAAQPHWEVGWLASNHGHHINWMWFWIWNTSLFIPLLVVAMLWRGTLPSLG
ncbi:MAG: hypothetical protein ACREN8_11745 [Candidatus Dormibacteraceae bacterium]